MYSSRSERFPPGRAEFPTAGGFFIQTGGSSLQTRWPPPECAALQPNRPLFTKTGRSSPKWAIPPPKRASLKTDWASLRQNGRFPTKMGDSPLERADSRLDPLISPLSQHIFSSTRIFPAKTGCSPPRWAIRRQNGQSLLLAGRFPAKMGRLNEKLCGGRSNDRQTRYFLRSATAASDFSRYQAVWTPG